jgi:small GTP-binding protein
MAKRYKVILVGPKFTGKTSIIRRYTNNDFILNYCFTPLPVETVAPIQDDDCELTIWDTAGDEDWVSMNTSTYHGSDAVIFVASFDKKDTLDNVITTWKPTILDHITLETVVCVLAINKCDLMEGSEVTQSDIDRAAEQIRPKTHTMNVSAKENVNIKELFVYVAKELMKKHTKPAGATSVELAPPKEPAVTKKEDHSCC